MPDSRRRLSRRRARLLRWGRSAEAWKLEGQPVVRPLFFGLVLAVVTTLTQAPPDTHPFEETAANFFISVVAMTVAMAWMQRRSWRAGWHLDVSDRMHIWESMKRGECPDDVRLVLAVLERVESIRRNAELDDRYRLVPLVMMFLAAGWALFSARDGEIVRAVTWVAMAVGLAGAGIRSPRKRVTARARADRVEAAAQAVLKRAEARV